MDQFLAALANPAVISVVAMVLEVVLHKVPSEKPMGILHGAVKVLKMAGAAADGLAAFLDKVIPQNLG